MSGRLFLLIGKTSVNDFFFDVFINQVTSLLTVTYVKLQNAYITETAALGKYSVIGYEIPGSQTFDYTETSTGWDNTYGTITLTASTNVSALWVAKAKVALNDCTKDTWFALTGAKSSTGSGVDYTAGIGAASNVATITGDYATKCLPLVSSFKTIGDNN